MATMYHDEDADLALIQSKKVAVIGYGSQGHAHALSLRDSGVDVVVGLAKDSKSRAKAEAEGLKVALVADAVKGADVLGQLFQFGIRELLGDTTHHAVVAAPGGLPFNLVRLERHKQIVFVLTGNFGIAGINRLVQVGTMAGHTSTFGQQFSGFAFGFSGFVRHGNSGAMLLVVGGNIGNVLVGQRLGNAAHGWMFALTGFISIQRSSDVLGTLTRDHGYFVNLRKTGLVALDAMATNAHGDFCRPGLGIALELLGHSGGGHTSGSKGQHKRQFGVHFEKGRESI